MQVASLNQMKKLIKESSISLNFVSHSEKFVCGNITKLPFGTDAENYEIGTMVLTLEPLEFFILSSQGEWYNQLKEKATDILQQHGLEPDTPELFPWVDTGTLTLFYNTESDLPTPTNLPVGLAAYVISEGDFYLVTTDKEWMSKAYLEIVPYPLPNSDNTD